MVDQSALVRPLFTEGPRSDERQAGYNESRFNFLDRSSWPYSEAVRELLISWLSQVPAEPQNDMIGRLKSDDAQHERAFWELYLHEAYRRSGFDLQFHPPLAWSSHTPDLLVSSPTGSFYLEATSPNDADEDSSARRRLAEVYDVLDRLETLDFGVGVFHYSIGSKQLSASLLRSDIRRWLSELDVDEVKRRVEEDPTWAPSLNIDYDDWSFEIYAFLRGSKASHNPRPVLDAIGPAEGSAVDNSSPLVRAILGKAKAYGAPDLPLVIAVLANTYIPTWDHQVERALFGAATKRPSTQFVHEATFHQAGVWASAGEWKRTHVPQIICSSGLSYRTLGTNIPRLWSTLDQNAEPPTQPNWLATVSTGGPEPTVNQPAIHIGDHLEIESDWLRGVGFQPLPPV